MWFRTDDGFLEHVKVIAAADALGGPNALGRVAAVWLEGGLYAARNLTDGYIPARVVDRFLTDEEPHTVAAALVAAHIWIAVPGGYRVHDWSDFQPCGAEVKAKRARDRDRKRAGSVSRETSRFPAGVATDSARIPRGVDTDSDRIPERSRARDPVPDPLPRSKAEEHAPISGAPSLKTIWEFRPHILAATHKTVEQGGEYVDADGAPNVGAIADEVKRIVARDLRATWEYSREIDAMVAAALARRDELRDAAARRDRFRARELVLVQRLGGVR